MKRKANDLRPIKRSNLQLKLGMAFYTYTRYALWLSHKFKFAKEQCKAELPYIHFSHRSLLLHQL